MKRINYRGDLHVQAVPAAHITLLFFGFGSGLSSEVGRPIKLIGG